MRKRFFLGLILVVALIWGPMWAWSHYDLTGTIWKPIMPLSLVAGISLGGYLLWGIVWRALLGPDDD